MSAIDIKPETTPSDRDLLITHTFDAPLHLVWAAWTDPERLKLWFFPDRCALSDPHFDVRPGGAYRCTYHGENGMTFRLRGVFREIAPERRLVFTHGWANDDGVVENDTEITATFEDLGGRTRVSIRQVGLSSEESILSHGEGWSEAFDHLAAILRPDMDQAS